MRNTAGLLAATTCLGVLGWGCQPKKQADARTGIPPASEVDPGGATTETPLPSAGDARMFPLSILATDPFADILARIPRPIARGKVVDPDIEPVYLDDADPFGQRLTGTLDFDGIDIEYDSFGYDRQSLMKPAEDMERAGAELRYAQKLFKLLFSAKGWLGGSDLPMPEEGARKFKLAPVESMVAAPEFALLTIDALADASRPVYRVDLYQRYFDEDTRRVERTGRIEFQKIDASGTVYGFKFLKSFVSAEMTNYRSYVTLTWRSDSRTVDVMIGYKLIAALSNPKAITELNWVRLVDDESFFRAVGGFRWRSHSEEGEVADPDLLYDLFNGEDDLFALVGVPGGDEVTLSFAPLLPSEVEAAGWKATPATFSNLGLGSKGRAWVVRRLRDQDIYPGCATLGADIKGSYASLSEAPSAVQSLPDDLCWENSALKDDDLATTLDTMCLSDSRPEVDLEDLGFTLGEKADGTTFALCERVFHNRIAVNPMQMGLFDGQPSIVHWRDSIDQAGTAVPLTPAYAPLIEAIKETSFDFSILSSPVSFELNEMTFDELSTGAEPSPGAGE